MTEAVKKTRRRENNRDIRKSEIMESAVELSKSKGYTTITGEQLAAFAGVARSLINFYFGGMKKLKKELVKMAIRDEILPILSQALSHNDPSIKTINSRLRRKVVEYLNTH